MDLEALIHAAKTGDIDARDQLGDYMISKLAVYFRKALKNHSNMDELIQRTCVDMLGKLDEFEYRGPASFRNWITRAASLEVKDAQREFWRVLNRERTLAEHPQKPKTSPTTSFARTRILAMVSLCLSRLPREQQRAIVHEMEGGTDEELATREAISVATVRTRRHRARKKLRRLLEREGLTRSTVAQVFS